MKAILLTKTLLLAMSLVRDTTRADFSSASSGNCRCTTTSPQSSRLTTQGCDSPSGFPSHCLSVLFWKHSTVRVATLSVQMAVSEPLTAVYVWTLCVLSVMTSTHVTSASHMPGTWQLAAASTTTSMTPCLVPVSAVRRYVETVQVHHLQCALLVRPMLS